MNVLDNVNSTENGNAIYIGQLILDELKCIRKELKEEVKKLGDKFQEFVSAKNGIESKTLGDKFQEFVSAKNGFESKALNSSQHYSELTHQKRNEDLHRNRLTYPASPPIEYNDEENALSQNDVDVSRCFEDIEVPKLVAVQTLARENHLLQSVTEPNVKRNNVSEVEIMPQEEVVGTTVTIEEISSDVNSRGEELQNIERKPLCGKKLRKILPKKHKYTPSYSICDYENEFEMIKNNEAAEVEAERSDTEEDSSLDLQDWHRLVKAHKYNYQCKICGHYFSQHGSLRRHLRIHTGEKPFKCKLCNKKFIRTDDLRLHIKKMHAPLPRTAENKTEPLEQMVANPSSQPEPRTLHPSLLFSSATAPVKHPPDEPITMLADSLSKKAGSSAITQSIETQRLLQHEVMSVLENYPAIPEHVRNNLKTRNGKKIYKCNVCDKSFIYTSQSYRRHMMIHTGERPYTCEYCHKGFIRAANLRLHVRTHTGEKPFQCTYCNESFRLRPRLIKHLQSHMEYAHKIE